MPAGSGAAPSSPWLLRVEAAYRRSPGWALVWAWAALVLVYAASPVRTPFDSVWAIHTAWSFAQGDLGALTSYPDLIRAKGGYAIEVWGGRPFSQYPIGPSLLALPFVVLRSLVDPGFVARLPTEFHPVFQSVIASLYGAAAVVLLFRAVEEATEEFRTALFAAVTLAFATSLWSVATRALWQHGPLICLYSGVLLLLALGRRRERWVAWSGALLALAVVVRPTALPVAAIVSASMLLRHRTRCAAFLAAAAPIALAWLAYNLSVYGRPTPLYYTSSQLFGEIGPLSALLGHLVSPGRGLLVYSPVLLLALPGAFLGMAERRTRDLAGLSLLVVLCHVGLASLVPFWWGGHSYGPRLLSDVLPFLAFLAALGVRGVERSPLRTRAALRGAVGLLLAVSVAVHARGALSWGPWEWNTVPRDVDTSPERLWDWSDPPPLRLRRAAAAR